MKRRKCTRWVWRTAVVLLLATTVAAIASSTVRHWLHEAWCYVFWSAIGMIPIALFFLVPSPERDHRDRSRRTVDWEMEQDRLREQEEEERWIEEHK